MQAFEQLFKAHYSELYHYAFSLVGSEGLAEDVVQDVFVQIWGKKKIAAINKAFLFVSVRNRSLDVQKSAIIRKRWQQNQHRISERASISVEAELESRDLEKQIKWVMGQMPARRREIFVLSRHYGFKRKEIAQMLGISEKAVKTQMGKALAMFKKSLRDWGEVVLSIVVGLFFF